MAKAAKILIALIIFVAVGVLHIAFNVTGILGRGGDLRWVNTGRGVPYTADASPVFHAHGAFFYVATRDGVRLVSGATGESRFHETLNLRRPIHRGRGPYFAVSEGEQGRIVYLYDLSGRVFAEVFDHPIHNFSINAQGFLTVISQIPDGYSIYIFHRHVNDGNRYRRYIRENVHPNIIPIAAEVSDSGRYITVALLDFNNRLETQVQFAQTYERDADWGTYGIFFSYIFRDELLLHMQKTSETRTVVITDGQIAVFDRGGRSGQTPTIEKVTTIPLHNRISELAFDNEGRFAVAFGSPLLNHPEAAADGTVHIFDARGVRTGVYETGRRVTHLAKGHGMTIIGTDRNFHAVNREGVRGWEFVALHATQDFLFMENSDTVLIAGSNRADVWRRQRVRDGEGDFFGIQGQE